MAFDDIVGGPDFTGDSVLDRVANRIMSDLPPGANGDMILNRLNRKLAEPRKADTEPVADKSAPDLSDEGIRADKLPDFSSEGVPAQAPRTYAQGTDPMTAGDAQPGFFGSPEIMQRAAINATLKHAGGIAQGGAALYDNGIPAAPAAPQYDALGNPIGTQSEPQAAVPAKPLHDRTLYRAGDKLKQAADRMAPVTAEEANTLAGHLGSGIGTVAPYIATAPLLGPWGGAAVAGGAMGLDSFGSTYEAAKQAGKSDDEASNTALKSAGVSAVLGALPLPAASYVKGLLKKAVAGGATFAGAGEAQEYLLQQIAKDYDPKAGYTLDQKRLIAELILGGTMGMFHPSKPEPPPQPAPTAQPAPSAQPSAGLPPPGGGGGTYTGTGPRTGPNGWPGGTGSWSQPPGGGAGPHPNTGTPPPGGQTRPGSGPGTPPPPGGMGPDFSMDPATRAKMERAYRFMTGAKEEKQGNSTIFSGGDDPSKMSDADLYNAVREHTRGPGATQTGEQAKPETPEEAKARDEHAQRRDEDANLKAAFGWMTDAQIQMMTPEMRAVWLKRAAGGSAGPEATKSEKPAESATEPPQAENVTTSPNDATGTRESPIKAETADDVLKAQPAEPKSQAQAEAENYQHAHVELPHLGLTGARSISIETGVGQERKGVDAEGKPWSVTMEHGAYGRLKGTEGADGAELDAFIGPHPTSPHVFIIDQHDPKTGEFDEHKIMLGYRTPIDALHAYANAYNDKGKDRIGHVTAMGPDEFKAWLKGDTTKPLAPVKRPDSSTHKAEESGQYASPNKALHSTEASNDVPKGSSETTLAGAPDASKPTSIDTDSAADTVGQPTQGNTQGRDRYVRQRTMNDDRHALTLMQFIASKGGIKPSPELQALGIDSKLRVQVPGRKGFFSVVREQGHEHDIMRRMAQEDNYFPRDNAGTSPDRTLTEFYDALTAEHNHGQPKRSEGNELHKSKKRTVLDAERDQHERERDEADYGEARAAIAVDYPDLPSDVRELAARIMADEGEANVDNAVENAALRLTSEYAATPEEIDAKYGEGAFDEIPAPAAPRDGGPSASEGADKPEPGKGQEDRGARERVPATGKARGESEKPAADDTAGQDADTEREAADRGTAAEAGHEPATESADDAGDLNDYIADIERKITKGDYDADIAPTRDAAEFKKAAEARGWLYGAFGKGKALWSPDRKHYMFYGAPVEGNHLNVQWGKPSDGVTAPDAEKEAAAKVAAQDAPTWAEVLHQLPMSPDGRTRQHEIAFSIMTEMTGKKKPNFNKLTPEQKVELLARVKAKPEPAPSEAEQQSYVDNAVREIAGNTKGGHESVQRAIDRGAPDAELIDTASRDGWGGSFGGRTIDRGWVEGRGKAVTVNGPFGEVEVKGKKLADALRRAFPKTPTAEQGADNKDQLVIPGTEKEGQGTQAQRKADAALKPKVAQKPADDGLFGDGHKQTDLLDLASDTKTPTIKPEDDSDGVSLPIPDGDARAEPEADASAGKVGRTGTSGEAEGAGGEPPVPADHGGQAQDLAEPAGDRGSGEGDAVRVSGRPEQPEDGRAERDTERAARAVKGENYRIEPGALGEDRGPKAKATDNVQAIKLSKRILEEGRPATAAEQHQLARYVGWGGLKNAFPDASGNIAKGFEQVAADLKEILTPEEYDTARRSIQYAHYTSEDVINGMWDIAERLGFKGGHVFEPGMGVGHFAGLMPPDAAAHTTYNGVEMDHVTARIAGLLYPKWGVRQADFTKMPLAENAFDLVIGNPPFADIGIQSDPKYPQKFLLHDYFFAKSLDAVRPGGLLAFVTSAGTMNKRDPGARKYLADRADLVGAIRLPSNAFKKNAGTDVTTDILILRKRLPDEAAGTRTWTEVGKVTLPGPDGQPTDGYMSQYFIDHPEMVLGKQDFASKLYKDYYSVKAWDNFDLKDALAVAIGKLPRNLMSEAETPQHKAEVDFEGTEKKDGSYYLKDGKLYQQRGGAGMEVERRGKGVEGGKSAAELERIRGLIPIRDALRETFAADLADDADAGKRARSRLNKSYDEFVAKFGPINKADITTRRPNSIQEEAARSEAREEARYAGEDFNEGSFDPSSLIELKKPLTDIARARKAAREAQGESYREGDFDPELMPPVVTDKRPNIDPFIDDQESYRLRAIEDYDQPTGKAEKRDVFFKNVISKDRPPEIKNIDDAVLHVLNQKGTLDLDAIGALVNKSRTQAIEALGERIYQVPDTKETWETREKYLSGNVLKKLAIAKAAAEKNPIYRRNVDALEAAQPAQLAPSQIGASLGMPWIPPEVIGQFGTEALGLEGLKAHYIPALASWTVSGDTDSMAATTTWGTARRNATALIGDALNRQSPRIYDQLDKDTRVLNVVATQAAQEKVQAIRDKFNEWVFSDEKRADRLASFYNEKYNNLVAQEYNGDHLTTPGIAASWNWRPHQTRVIARIIESGNTYMAHAVGAGKTSAMIGAGMEMRRLGLAKKPMYAVPNHMLAQFTKEFYEQYPTARLIVADERQFHTDRRKQFVANVALSDLDAVIITHSAFGKIPVSDEFSDQIIQEELDEYRHALAELPKGQDNRITRARIEKQIERLEQRLSGKSNRKRDSVFNFDEMGVDFLFVDEAHLFRKLDFSTQMSNLKGITPEGSGMAWDLYVKTKLLEKRNPGRSLVLASGTPITNTMAELFTVSRYLQPHELIERQLHHFDAWAGAFGEHVTSLEQDAAGGYKPVTRFAKFVNAAELSTMVRQVMDSVTSRQLEQYVVRPKIKDGKRQMNLAEKSPALEAYQAALAARMKAMEERKGKPEKGDDIMLKVIGDGRHAAIDMRLVGGKADANHPSKLDLLIDNVAGIHKRTTVKKFYRPRDGSFDMSAPSDTGPATQMIFANLGISGSRGFSVPDYIRAELVRRGVPRAEIAFISDYKSHVAKQKLFNDMNEGKVRVLIGSTAKMATGVNAQQRLYAVHNLDPLWYPSDDEQRIGRALRQNNRNPEIEIHDYSTKGTYDSTMWGMMERKARFIQGFFEGDPSMRSMEDLGEASQYEQAKALTTNDPRLMKLTELRQELEKANRRKAAFDNEQYAVRRRRADAESDIARYSGRELAIEKDIEQRVPLHGDNFKAKIGRESFDKRVDFGEALLGALDKIMIPANSGRHMPIGEISGFSLVATPQKLIDEMTVHVDLKRNGGAESHITVGTSGLGAVRSMESVIGGFDHDLAHVREKLKTARKFLKESEGQSAKKFTGGSDMETLASEIRVLQAELSAPKEGEVPAQVPAVAEPTELSESEGAYGRTAAPQYVTTGIRLRVGPEPGAIGQAHVLNSGRGNGNEFLVAYNAKGHEVDRAEGDPGNVQIPPALDALLRTPGADIVVHHNHPSDSSLSPQDIGMLALPGLSGLWAHGHGGNVYRAELTPEFRVLLPKGDATPGYYVLRRLVKLASDRLLDAIQPAVNAYEVSVDEANPAHGHLVNEVLRRAGIIDYQTNFEIGDFIDRVPGLHSVVESAVISARLEAFGGNSSGNVRRPRPLRHAGDLGAVFDKAELATPVGQQAPLGTERQAYDRTQAPREISDATGSLSESDNTFKKPGSLDNSINDILRKRLLGKLGDLNMTEARTQLQDKFIRVRHAEESVGAPSDQSAHQAESLYYGRTGQRLESLTEHHIDPLLRDMKARDIDLEGMDKFLYARHAVERNAKIAAMYPPGHDFHEAATDPNIVGGSGLSKRQAQDILNAIAPKIADYKAVAAKIDALNLKTRRALLDGGLISRETFDEMNAAYRWYVPLRGFEGSEHEESLRQGAGMNIGGKETRAAFGRKSLAASPLAYSIMQAELAIVRAEKNKVGNTFLKFVRANPDPDRWTVNRPQIVKRIDKATGLVTTMPNNLTRQADNVFETKVDGKPVYITLKGTDGLNLARALGNMGTANAHALIRTYSVLTHTMAKVATQWNPDFMIPNLARDLGEAFINLSAQDQSKFARNFASHILPAIRGSMLAIAGKTPAPGSKMARYVAAFHRFDQAGGRIRFFGIDNPDQIESNVNKKLARLQGGALNTIRDIGEKAAKALEIAGGGIENATRLAAFMAAEQAGFSQADAAAFGRNLTVDFNKKGELGPVISSLYMFAGAGIQGTARMGRALGHRRVMMAVAALAAASALATLLAIEGGGEDEAGTPFYMKIPHWERDKNLIFMLPKGAYLKLPLPYGFSPFAVLASHATSVLLGHEKPGKAAAAVLDSIISAFNPLGEEGSVISDLIPSALRPFAHISFNLDWTGRPLYPANDPSRGTKPDSSQFFRTNSEFSKEAAKKLNEWSGGSAYNKGAVDVHPGSIDHFLSSYTGGVGRFAKTLVDTIVSGYRDHEWNPEKTPVIRRFYGKVGADADRAAYYEARQPEKDRQSGVAQARKDQKASVNTEAAKEFIAENTKENPQKQIFKSADSQMKRLRQDEDKINAGTLGGAEKKAALNDVRERMRAVQNSARAESTLRKQESEIEASKDADKQAKLSAVRERIRAVQAHAESDRQKYHPPAKTDAITIRPIQGAQ